MVSWLMMSMISFCTSPDVYLAFSIFVRFSVITSFVPFRLHFAAKIHFLDSYEVSFMIIGRGLSRPVLKHGPLLSRLVLVQ